MAMSVAVLNWSFLRQADLGVWQAVEPPEASTGELHNPEPQRDQPAEHVPAAVPLWQLTAAVPCRCSVCLPLLYSMPPGCPLRKPVQGMCGLASSCWI